VALATVNGMLCCVISGIGRVIDVPFRAMRWLRAFLVQIVLASRNNCAEPAKGFRAILVCVLRSEFMTMFAVPVFTTPFLLNSNI